MSFGSLFLRKSYTNHFTVRPVQKRPEPERGTEDALSEDDSVPAGVAEPQVHGGAAGADEEVHGEASDDGTSGRFSQVHWAFRQYERAWESECNCECVVVSFTACPYHRLDKGLTWERLFHCSLNSS